ncbi:PQQ-dependent sugar dehydrogenase [Pedococcus sp. 5OH_020]|uniref:PQQ-dependent sugar dehydrogenase n=1 Tax=Pedococcus sp. 5OH_020 TaxID=2989814 RepID=UPI0022E9E493|nr:PQQ-dependent sugar dehydrogenase [Pedococcus sp. 5OH_020]
MHPQLLKHWVAAFGVTGCLLPLLAPATGADAAASVAVTSVAVASATVPASRVDTLVSGLSIPWDVAPLPDGSLLFTERAGTTRLRAANGPTHVVTTDQRDLFVGSEAGLMGITTDPAFTTNRTYYTCQAYRGSGTTPIDIRVVRWHLAADSASATRQGTVVTGVPTTTGQHAGCRLRFAADGTLHVGTGDAITGTNPQNLSSLGGKTLRVRAGDGRAPADNPFAAAGGARALVWTYGHRNVEGMALRPGTTQMWSVEHGPDRDDEVNLLVKGRNYGWDPVPGYNQQVPMTDLVKFPTAVRAVWSSGLPTVATSGAAFLTGSRWGRWEGALAVAELKNEGVRILSLTPDGRLRGNEQLPAVDNVYGRIRTVQAARGGNAVYLTTSNGTDDKLLQVTATAAQGAYRPQLDVSPAGVALVNRGGVLTAFVRGLDGRVYHSGQSSAGGSWTAFQPLPGVVASAPAAVSWGGSRVDLFARGTSGQLLHAWSSGGGYSAWQNLGGNLTSAPSAASLSPGSLDVVARSGASDKVVRRHWDGRSWSASTSLGGVVTGAPATTASASTGRITVYVRGSDGKLCTKVLTATTTVSGWSCGSGRETWAAPAVSASPGPVLVTRNADLTPVVSIGGFTTAVGGRVDSALAAASRSSTSYTVIGRGTDGALWSFDGRPGHYTWSRVGGRLS